MRPLVSILIPAYNAEAWISDTIKSALAQTWPRIEIIIVDDGSTDKTLKIGRQYECSNLRIISQENRGGCAARNRAFHECQGDYIQWLDADDLLAPDKVERQLNVASSDMPPDVLFSSAWGTFFYRPKRAKFRRTPLWKDLDAVEWMVLRLSNPWMMPVSAWLVSRSLTDRAGPWDERLLRNQDGEYFFRVVSLSEFVKFVEKSRFYYRKANRVSISRSRSRKIMESHCLSFELEVRHALSREDSTRTRTACVKRLNTGAAMLGNDAADLADRLRERIKDLGGVVVPRKSSRKYGLVQSIIGGGKAAALKNAVWQTGNLIRSNSDLLLSKLFGTGI